MNGYAPAPRFFGQAGVSCARHQLGKTMYIVPAMRVYALIELDSGRNAGNGRARGGIGAAVGRADRVGHWGHVPNAEVVPHSFVIHADRSSDRPQAVALLAQVRHDLAQTSGQAVQLRNDHERMVT